MQLTQASENHNPDHVWLVAGSANPQHGCRALGNGLHASRLLDRRRSIKPLLLGEPGAKSPHEALFFYAGSELHAVRSGPWKLHFAHSYLTTAGEPGRGGRPSNWGKLQPKSITQSGVDGIASRHGYRVEQLDLSLFQLAEDPGEEPNVAAAHPEIVKRLSGYAEAIRQELGDTLQNRKGSEVRAAGLDP